MNLFVHLPKPSCKPHHFRNKLSRQLDHVIGSCLGVCAAQFILSFCGSMGGQGHAAPPCLSTKLDPLGQVCSRSHTVCGISVTRLPVVGCEFGAIENSRGNAGRFFMGSGYLAVVDVHRDCGSCSHPCHRSDFRSWHQSHGD